MQVFCLATITRRKLRSSWYLTAFLLDTTRASAGERLKRSTSQSAVLQVSMQDEGQGMPEEHRSASPCRLLVRTYGVRITLDESALVSSPNTPHAQHS